MRFKIHLLPHVRHQKCLSETFNQFNLYFSRKQPKTFAFDHCFYSTDANASNYATQEVVFDTVGRDILDNAFQGYNACMLAYGQTGKIDFSFYLPRKIPL